jgi:hypothetical protein
MKKILLIAVPLIVSGCATTPSPQEMEIRKQVAASIPTCKETKECEVKWAASRNWILANSGYKFQHLQADFMETYNSTDSSTSLAVRVLKEPQQDGSYKFMASVWCANWIGCVPDKWVALKHFNDFVTASWKP